VDKGLRSSENKRRLLWSVSARAEADGTGQRHTGIRRSDGLQSSKTLSPACAAVHIDHSVSEPMPGHCGLASGASARSQLGHSGQELTVGHSQVTARLDRGTQGKRHATSTHAPLCLPRVCVLPSASPLAAAAHAEKPLPQAKKTRGRVQSRAAQNAEESTETMASQALIAVSPDGRYVAAQVQHLLTVVEQRYGRSAPDNAVADFCGRGRGRDSANRC
jgi:hypothetical protein